MMLCIIDKIEIFHTIEFHTIESHIIEFHTMEFHTMEISHNGYKKNIVCCI